MTKRTLYIFSLFALIGCDQVQQREETEKSEKAPESKEITYSKIQTFLNPQQQSFLWTADSDTVLTCLQGTKIYLPKNCFSSDNYNPDVPVEIEITECYQLSDFISQGLTTLSGDALLETGGMINIRIHQKENDLACETGQEYAVLFPKGDMPKESMHTFYGERNASGAITWESKEVIEQDASESISPELITRCKFKQTTRAASIGDEEVVWKLKETGAYVPDYIDRNIQLSQKMIDDFCELDLHPYYQVQYHKNGAVRDIKIKRSATKEYDKVICDFIRNMPQVDMSTMPKSYPNAYYTLGFRASESMSYDNESYKKKFVSKYAAFRNQVVTEIDNAELNYYVLTASKFGWINCDRFWNTDDEKIDYLVEIENKDAVNLNLVFSDINSIMPATKIGDKYVFKNVPVGRDVKLVCIGYDGESATLAIEKTRISTNKFKLSGFRSFKLSELEKELNSN